MDISLIPQQVATQFNISLFSAQILTSTVVLMLVLLPLIVFRRGRTGYAELIVGLPIMGFLIAVGWLPFWFLVILAFLTAGSVTAFIVKQMG